jgi:hypothetical protein
MPNSYRRFIIEELSCNEEDAAIIEDLMREHVFHSTLDWQSEAQLRRGAREAWAILEEDRDFFVEHYRERRALFAEMKAKESAA